MTPALLQRFAAALLVATFALGATVPEEAHGCTPPPPPPADAHAGHHDDGSGAQPAGHEHDADCRCIGASCCAMMTGFNAPRAVAWAASLVVATAPPAALPFRNLHFPPYFLPFASGPPPASLA